MVKHTPGAKDNNLIIELHSGNGDDERNELGTEESAPLDAGAQGSDDSNHSGQVSSTTERDDRGITLSATEDATDTQIQQESIEVGYGGGLASDDRVRNSSTTSIGGRDEQFIAGMTALIQEEHV